MSQNHGAISDDGGFVTSRKNLRPDGLPDRRFTERRVSSIVIFSPQIAAMPERRHELRRVSDQDELLYDRIYLQTVEVLIAMGHSRGHSESEAAEIRDALWMYTLGHGSSDEVPHFERGATS